MTNIENAPLLEAIFELRWGEVESGKFQYKSDDQQLFVGKINASLESEGYDFVESLNDNQQIPFSVSHRFRQKPQAYPCYQAGLGIFTVNQVNEGYSWVTFRDAIRKGLNAFDRSGPNKLTKISDTMVAILRMQDVFYLSTDAQALQEYLQENFHVSTALPTEYFNSDIIDSGLSGINCQFDVRTNSPKGQVVVKIATAIVEGQPAIMVETLVVSKAQRDFEGAVSSEQLLDWAEKAHLVQKHSFENLVNPSAYRN